MASFTYTSILSTLVKLSMIKEFRIVCESLPTRIGLWAGFWLAWAELHHQTWPGWAILTAHKVYCALGQLMNPTTLDVRPPSSGLFAYFPPSVFRAQLRSEVYQWYGEPYLRPTRVIVHLIRSVCVSCSFFFLAWMFVEAWNWMLTPNPPWVATTAWDVVLRTFYGGVEHWFPDLLAVKPSCCDCDSVHYAGKALDSGHLDMFIHVCAPYYLRRIPLFAGWSVLLRALYNWAVPLSVVLVFICSPLREPGKSPFPFTNVPHIRSKFRELVIKATKRLPVHHSHPKAAGDRNAADDAINAFIGKLGFSPYSVQASVRDAERGIDGSVRHLWSVDLSTPQRDDNIGPHHIFKMINVDYYVDWTDYLWMCKPFVLYTFTPRDPAGSHQEIQWTTNADNTITMEVAGGAKFTHQLWDYNVDHFRAFYPGVCIDYAVERVPVNTHWSVVLISPRAVAKARRDERPSHSLRRMQLVHQVKTMDGTTRPSAMIRVVGEAPYLSLAIPGHFAGVRIKPHVEAVLTGRFAIGKTKFPDLAPLLHADFGNDLRLAQATIYTAYPADQVLAATQTAIEAQTDAMSYSRVPTPRLMVDERATVTPLSTPVLDSCYAPKRSRANDEWCIEARVDSIHNPAERLPPQYEQYADEFLRLLIPVPHSLHPVSAEEVIESQKRPTQRVANADAYPRLSDFLANPALTIKSFQKGELYGAMKDPRNISTLPTEHCLWYSQYTQSLAKVFKTQPWYAFGLHPNQVADRVHLLALNSRTLTETDFSRFDGTHSHALYDLELRALLRAFPPSEHETIRKIHYAMTSARARTGCGVSYEPDGSRASGASDTSLGNSFDNAYATYCMYRRMGFGPVEAYKKLGIYGGDDGLTPDADVKRYEQVAKDLGLILKATTRPSSHRTTFLGRVYPNPMGHPGHMADTLRQLPKLHAVASRDPEVVKYALHNKATGHLVTDPDTPVLSNWARMMLRCEEAADADTPETVDERHWSWLARETKDEQGRDRSYKLYQPPRDEMLAEVASQLEMNVEEVQRYCDYLDSITVPGVPDFAPVRAATEPELPKPGVMIGGRFTELKAPKPTHCPHGCGTGACDHGGAKLVDEAKTCATCSEPFVFTVAEQVKAHSYSGTYKPVKHCKTCRNARKDRLARRAHGDGEDEKRSSAPPPTRPGESKGSGHDSPFGGRGDQRTPLELSA